VTGRKTRGPILSQGSNPLPIAFRDLPNGFTLSVQALIKPLGSYDLEGACSLGQSGDRPPEFSNS
jgi:hypothetical protein